MSDMKDERRNTKHEMGAEGAAGFERLAALSHERPVWVRVGQLVDGLSFEVQRNADVVFTARQILFAGIDGKTPPREMLPPGQLEPDATLPQHTLLPCLIEAHAHLFLD